MRTLTISKDHRKRKQAMIQRETIIAPVLCEKFKREKKGEKP